MWQAARKPNNYWDSLHSQREFFELLGNKLGIQSKLSSSFAVSVNTCDCLLIDNALGISDWQNVTVAQVMAHGGGGLLSRYDGSLVKALHAMYPLTPLHNDVLIAREL